MPTAGDLMSVPIRSIRPDTVVCEAQRVLMRGGRSGASVVDDRGRWVGCISRRDVDVAIHYGFGQALVKHHMNSQARTVELSTPLPAIAAIMAASDIEQLPVLASAKLVGVVTSKSVLRQLWGAHLPEADSSETKIGLLEQGKRSPLASELRQELQQRLNADLWDMLEAMTAVADARGWQLYLIGGGVRDLFLTPASEPLKLEDVDLVVDSAHQTSELGAGVVLAQAVQTQHPEAELQVYGQFQTAALVWREAAESDRASLMMDIATARTEFYPYPAANPEVEASSIDQDLDRRDFTINAMGIRLNSPQAGQLIDRFGGLTDLEQRQIRVLHANSFIEDPTRIYRAVRFAVRLNFTLEPQTEAYIRYALASGVYEHLQQTYEKVPALQARLKAELKYMLEAPYWQAALSQLNQLGALACIHPSLTLNESVWQQLQSLDRWLQASSPIALKPWQMRLELIIAAIAPAYRSTVAARLQLPSGIADRLAGLSAAEAAILTGCSECDRPSQWMQLLQPYDAETLVLASVRHPQAVGEPIWQYFTEWRHIKAVLNGNDLKQLGYRPSPDYKIMLNALLAATIDGEVSDRAAAEAFITSHYPLA